MFKYQSQGPEGAVGVGTDVKNVSSALSAVALCARQQENVSQAFLSACVTVISSVYTCGYDGVS